MSGRLLSAVTINGDELRISVDPVALARMLEVQPPESDEPLELTTAASKVREGKATRLVLTDAKAASEQVAITSWWRCWRKRGLPATWCWRRRAVRSGRSVLSRTAAGTGSPS